MDEKAGEIFAWSIFDWMFLSSIEMAYDFSKNEGMHRTDYGVEKASGQIFEL